MSYICDTFEEKLSSSYNLISNDMDVIISSCVYRLA